MWFDNPGSCGKIKSLDEVTQDLKERRAGAEIAKRLGDWQGFIAKTSELPKQMATYWIH